MDLQALGALTLTDATGSPQQLGTYWADRPVVLVFLRHFGCLLCREHAAQLGEHYDEITQRGGEVVAVGTGNERYAAAFVEEEHIPFPVVVDDDAAAAGAASVRKLPFLKLVLNWEGLRGMRRARRAGHRVHKAGRRVTQLGATFVVGPGDEVRYEHIDENSADHAPLDDVLTALRIEPSRSRG
jgi:peroxiredoxin